MNRTKLTTIFFALLSLVAVMLVCCKDKNDPEEEQTTQPETVADDPLKNGTEVTTMSDEDINKLDDKTAKCWHVATQITVNKQTGTEDLYVWSTEHDLASVMKSVYDEVAAKYKLMGLIADVHIAYQQVDAKDRNACLDLNKTNPGKTEGDETCYLVTINMGLNAETFYVWTTEDLIKQFLANYDLPDVSVSWEAVSAKDEESCQAKNKD